MAYYILYVSWFILQSIHNTKISFECAVANFKLPIYVFTCHLFNVFFNKFQLIGAMGAKAWSRLLCTDSFQSFEIVDISECMFIFIYNNRAFGTRITWIYLHIHTDINTCIQTDKQINDIKFKKYKNFYFIFTFFSEYYIRR